MKTSDLIISFSVEDLTKYAPDGVKISLNTIGLIDVIPVEYAAKYPNIQDANDIFNTGVTLRDLTTEVGQFVSIGGKRIPVGDIDEKSVNDIFRERFVGRVDPIFPKDGGKQKKNISAKGTPTEINMKDQTAKLDEYGKLTSDEAALYKSLKDFYKKMSEMEAKKPGNNLMNKFKRKDWDKKYSDLHKAVNALDKERNAAQAARVNMFYKLNYKPADILAFVYKKAAQEKIATLLIEFKEPENFKTKKKFQTAISNLKRMGVDVNGTAVVEKSGVVHADVIAVAKLAKYAPIFTTRSNRFPEIQDLNAKYAELTKEGKRLTAGESNLLLQMMGHKRIKG